MARYHVIHWKEIPSLVEAFSADQVVRVPLSQRFQDLIDALAMRDGASEAGPYLDGWGQGPDLEASGSPDEVAAQVAAELEAGFQELVVKRFAPPAG